MTINKIELFEAATTGIITAGNSFTADFGTDEWGTYNDPNGTNGYEIVTSQYKVGSKSLRLTATTPTDSTYTTTKATHEPVTAWTLTKDLVFVLFCRPVTLSTTAGNQITVRLWFDDNGTSRRIDYYIDYSGTLPADTSTVGYIDVESDFSAGVWGRLTRNPYADFETKFETARGSDPVWDKGLITINKIELIVQHFRTADSNVEAYFDSILLKDGFRIIEPTIDKWDEINAGENDIWWDEGFAFLNSNNYTQEESPDKQIHLKAAYDGAASNSRLTWNAKATGCTNGDVTTHLFKWKATDLENAAGASLGIRFYWRSTNNGETFNVSFYADKMVDNTDSSETTITQTAGQDYFVRIVLNHGTGGTGTGSIYWNGSDTPFSISGEAGSGDAYQIGVLAQTSGAINEITLKCWKMASTNYDNEDTKASDMPWMLHPFVLKMGASDYRMWYASARWAFGSAAPTKAQNTNRIFYATSTDGESWTKQGLVLPPDDNASSQAEGSVHSPWVVWDGSTYHMYHAGGLSVNPDPSEIHYATSTDGINWTRQNGGDAIISIGGGGDNDEKWTHAPCVIRVASDDWVMYYAGLDLSYVFRIMRATSTDGSTWTKDAVNDPIIDLGTSGQWDDTSVLYPVVLRHASDNWEMFYAGYDGSVWQVGRATSTDGTSWTKDTTNSPVLAVAPSYAWDAAYANPRSIVEQSDGSYWLYYMGRHNIQGYIGIGLAKSDDGLKFFGNNGPFVENRNPVGNGTGQQSQNIYFELDDPAFVIDSGTIDVQVKVNSGSFVNVIVNGVFQSGYSGSITSDGVNGYNVTINPDTTYNVDDVITVNVDRFDNIIGDYSEDITYQYTVVQGATGAVLLMM